MRTFALTLIGLVPLLMAAVVAAAPAPSGKVARPSLPLEADPKAQFHFEGPVGERVQANTRGWLIPTPEANPGMLEMFRVRDRDPKPNLVPWAGEFVGKYLISAVQALRMDPDPELRATVERVVRELSATQAEDGYLGPFTRAERLRGHWDLWGHYHCMLGLLMWHEHSGDAGALRTARRAGDLVCATYLDSERRVIDAGSHEMNMAVIHGLGRLYRVTGEPRYLRMMREIEKDWERAGDYLRTGEAGVPFFQTPRPRWESLHDLQGLVELYQITGEERYRRAFESHWRTILRWDRRNTGGFSSGEQATGDPYAPTAIETCCTVSWMALSLDMLRLTGDPTAADELELSTYNGGLGAQHPSGRWWTYNTPMDGAREASAHTIVFQARAGTPELNCCSVNGPRVLGMLSEWAVMRDPAGLTVNFYAPGSSDAHLADGTAVALKTETDYPRTGKILLRVEPRKSAKFRLRVRIPAWAADSRVQVNGQTVAGVKPGYVDLERTWRKGDEIRLDLDLAYRLLQGGRDALGRVSAYRGPVLLTYDQALNPFDAAGIPPIDPAQLAKARLEPLRSRKPSDPWLVVTVPVGETGLRLCDYASAGARGTQYRSWLPAAKPLPPAAVPHIPFDGVSVPTGRLLFRWSGASRPGATLRGYRLVVASDPDLKQPVLEAPAASNRLVLEEDQARKLEAGRTYWWGVVGNGSHGVTRSLHPARFTVDPKLPPLTDAQLQPAAGGILISARLAGEPNPTVGKLVEAEGHRAVDGAVALDGARGRLKYALDAFPEESYTVAVRVHFDSLPQRRLGQVFSAWTAPSDDPLRLVVDGGKLFARIETPGGGAGTEGFPVQAGRWYSVVAVKDGSQLTLYVDGAVVGRSPAPYTVRSNSREVALGGNPRYTGNEFLAARFGEFSLHGHALSAEEVRALLPTR